MAELAARYLRGAGASRLLVTNRTDVTALRLADQYGGEAVPFTALASRLAEADIVICSTSAPDYIISPAMVRRALDERPNRSVLLVDISVPRNIDPKVAKINNVSLFDVDDLESLVTSNMIERRREAERAEAIIEFGVARFEECLRYMDTGPKIGAWRKELQEVARNELARQRRHLGELTLEQERAVEALLLSTVNKISHSAITKLNNHFDFAASPRGGELAA